MGQPNPPGDIPLFDGLGPEWNDIVGAFPEDQRADLAPKLKERIDKYESLRPWEDFAKSGVTPEHVNTALSTFTILENNPREVYETIGKYLGVTPAQAKEVVEEIEDGDQDDPRIQKMQHQLDTMAQVMLAQRNQTAEEQRIAEQEHLLEKEIGAIKKKYGNDVPEDEIVMRMIHKNMTAEQAYQEYESRVTAIRSRRPAPFVMGTGGNIPSKAIDPRKLDSAGTKNVVAQMIEHANHERNA